MKLLRAGPRAGRQHPLLSHASRNLQAREGYRSFFSVEDFLSDKSPIHLKDGSKAL